MTTDPLAHIAEALTLRPGDTLIIRVDPRTSPAHVDQLRRAAAALPGVPVVVIAAEQIAVQRAEEATP